MEEKDNSFEGCLFLLIYIGFIILVGYLMVKYGSSSAFEDWTPDYP